VAARRPGSGQGGAEDKISGVRRFLRNEAFTRPLESFAPADSGLYFEEVPMQRRWMSVLATAILAWSAAASQAAAHGSRMEGLIQRGICPKNDAAVVIVSKDPFCSAHHLSGDACEATWKTYWFETVEYNGFLENCRMQHWPEHKT